MAYGGRAARKIGLAEFEAMPAEDAYRIELVRGAVVREPRPGARHSRLVTELLARLREHVRAQGLGIVLVDTGFRLPGEPATVRGADVAFIAAARLPEVAPPGFWELAPDLAVEIVSPHDRWTAVQDKAFDYLDAGTREVWLIDPAARRATVYRSRAESFVVDDVLDGGAVVPGFSLVLRDFFDAIRLR